mgnify:FL=1
MRATRPSRSRLRRVWVSTVAMVVEFRDGRIWRDTRYYAEPFDAPEWGAAWVERMEDPPAGGG